MASNNFVHRSYRINQHDQYTFEALCHIRGSAPSQVVADLINQCIKDHTGADPTLDTMLAAIVERRINRVDTLLASTPEAAPE